MEFKLWLENEEIPKICDLLPFADANMAADVWRYYNGQRLAEDEWDKLHKAIDECTF